MANQSSMARIHGTVAGDRHSDPSFSSSGRARPAKSLPIEPLRQEPFVGESVGPSTNGLRESVRADAEPNSVPECGQSKSPARHSITDSNTDSGAAGPSAS